MAFDTSGIVAGQVARAAQVTQLFDFLTGTMTDQPGTIKNKLTLTRNVAATPAEKTYFNVVGVADTALDAEANDVYFNLARTAQFTAASAPSNQRTIRVSAPTYSATGSATIAEASLLSLSGAPIAGSNMTLTNSWALKIDGGGMKVGGGSVVTAGAALATSATSGFLYLPTCAGRPTGTPGAHTGTIPLVYDSTNDRLFLYSTTDSAWKLVGGEQPRVFVYRTSNKSINNNTHTFVDFATANTTEAYDTDSIHDLGSNTTRFTVPTGFGGTWLWWAFIAWDGNTSGNRMLNVWKNAAASSADITKRVGEAADRPVSDVLSHDGQGVVVLADGDYLELSVFQDSGGARTIEPISQISIGFGMVRISA